MVIFEAARAVTQLKDVTSRELTPAITVLQLFLSSSKPVLRFAAVRTLNKVSFGVLPAGNSTVTCLSVLLLPKLDCGMLKGDAWLAFRLQ
jgi:hypothetical protein